ncbi:MAG: hypothetical protein J7M06_04015, partial [Proteobacteria bacterium]|nr:hypothetical protein [Pseudomonadota bacterium]
YYQQVISKTKAISNPVERLKVAYKTLLEVGFSLEDEILFGWTEAKNMKKNHLQEVTKLELDLIHYFKDILNEITSQFNIDIEIENTNITANFLVYSATFGILRRWALRPLYSKEQLIDYLMNTNLKNIIPF